MSRDTTTDPKVKAQLVRQCIELAMCAKVLSTELTNTGDDMTRLFGAVSRAGDEVLVECIKMPGIRIAVFPIEGDGKEVK